MNHESNYLITLTNEYLNNNQPTLKNDVNYRQLFKTASQHNLLGVVYCVVKNAKNPEIVPSELLSYVENKFFDMVYISTAQLAETDALKRCLTEAEIRYVPFKGSVLRELYPVPESRIMGDIDILIDIENQSNARKALTAAGFECKNSNGPVWDYVKGGVLFEVHTSILNGKVGLSTAPEAFKDAINNAEFNGFEGTLPDTYHFEYLIAHLAHHFWFNGAGIKLILDLAMLLKHGNVDMDKALSELKKMGLGAFAEEMLTVCRKWYGVGIDNGRDVSKTEEFLLSYGAFGNTNRNEAAVVARKDIEDGNTDSPAFLKKLRFAFPPYSKLKEIPYIKFINGRPWLTPYAWVFRFFYNLKNRKHLMLNTAKELGHDEATQLAQEEFKYFKEIGLL